MVGVVGRLPVPVGVGVVLDGAPIVVVLASVGSTEGVSQLGIVNWVSVGVGEVGCGPGAVEVGTGPGWKFCSGSIGAAKVWVKVWCAPNIPNPDMSTVQATVTL